MQAFVFVQVCVFRANVLVLGYMRRCVSAPAGKADQPRSQRSIGPVRRSAGQPALRKGHSSQAKPGQAQHSGFVRKYRNMLNSNEKLSCKRPPDYMVLSCITTHKLLAAAH